MDIMSLDTSIFLISLIIASAILAFYYFSLKNPDYDCDASQGFAVIDAVRTLKKACPIQFNNKWRLLSQNYGPTRSWSKNISFPGFKNYIKLYGATCAVSCSSMYAFSIISDVSRWGEWEPSLSSQNLLLRSYDNNELKKDSVMLVDQIAGIQRGTNIQSYVAMYRFLSLPSKCTKWILFWNAKKFEFMFFVIQPAASRNGSIQCVITHLYSCIKHSSYSASLVTQRIRNIKDFLSLSQLNYRPVHYSTTTVPMSPKPSGIEKDLQKEENPSSVFPEEANCDNSDTLLYLVPLFHYLAFNLKTLKGYNLLLKKIKDSQPKKPREKEPSPKKLKSLEPLRRANSDISMMIKSSKLFSSNFKSSSSSHLALTIPNDLNQQSSDGVSDDIVVIEKSEIADNGREKESETSPVKSNSRSFSDPSVQSIEKSQASSLSELSEINSEEENAKSLDSISELDESTMVVGNHHDKNEFLCSSTSDFEVLDSNQQQFIDTQIASYLTQGNYGASVLQTEMMLASQFDSTLHTGNRVAGGWIHHSTHKGIPVFTKSISGKIMKILSFLCQIELPVYYKDVWRCAKNPRFRFFCDETVKSVEIVDRISETQRLIHVYHETGGLLRKEPIDFCLLQTEREEKTNFYSVFQSVEYEKCPFMTSVIRGNLKPSGWIVQNINKRSCKVTYLIQILVNTADNLYIHELSTLVPQSLHNLKHFVTSKPK